MKIFIGPSGIGLDMSELDVRPPARQGDIATAALEGKDTLILIDGYFAHTLSPWHKEILFAINNGCRVIGAASLGALRAVECERYGMEGIGEIYEWYKNAVCIDDADVALAHVCEQDGYTHCSIPLVNLIATYKQISKDLPSNFVSKCRSIFYADRSWGKINNVFGKQIHDLIKGNYVDQKLIDAKSAIELSKSSTSIKKDISHNYMNPYMVSLIENDVLINGKRKWEHATHEDEACDWNLFTEMAACLGVFPSEKEIESQSAIMWNNLGVKNPEEAMQWLNKNSISGEQWNMFAIKKAVRQSVSDWHKSITGGLKSVPISLEYQLLNNL
jgi:hypothetical protein